ncbi:MAG: HU family DNA-binding protein [Candidatus Poribacteria bacterium]|nr:HU family DNA-binding protein [Candidatus Poribacteria bacterium]
MAKLMKSDVVNSIVERTGLSKKDANAAVDAMGATICDALSNGDSVGLIGFGTFETKHRPARTGRNPQTGDPLDIPAKTVPVFKAGKKLRDAAA